MTQKTKALIALGLVCFFWGTTYLAMRTGVQHIPGLMLAAIRQLVCGALVVGWFLVKKHPLPDLATLLRLALVGTLMLGAGNGLMSWGEETVSGGLASVLAALSPLCMALFSIMMLKGARINATIVTGLLLGFAGIVGVFYPLLRNPVEPGFGFGILLIVLAVLGWSLASIYIARRPFQMNVFYASGWEMLLGGAALALASWVSGEEVPLAAVDSVAWLSIAYLVVFGSLVGFSAYQYALKHLPPTQVSIYGYINPLVALFLGWVLLREPLTWPIILGVVITLTGVYMVQRAFRARHTEAGARPFGRRAWRFFRRASLSD